MPEDSPAFNRRVLLQGGVATAAALAFQPAVSASDRDRDGPEICAFIKFIQSYSYDELAERMAEAGFDGVEATIRRNGYIEPAEAVDELPELVAALRKHGVSITVMTTDVVGTSQPETEPLLRSAANLGIARYRMGNYKYDLQRPILSQLDEIRPALNDLAALNRELGIQGLYQNHSGARYVGAPIWDIHNLIQRFPVSELGVAFDIRHATIEGGLAWPLHFDLMRPHIGAIYVKDFDWDGPKARHVPLGKGRVNPKFFAMLKKTRQAWPVSLHVEYLKGGSTEENLEALKTDLAQLRKWLTVTH